MERWGAGVGEWMKCKIRPNLRQLGLKLVAGAAEIAYLTLIPLSFASHYYSGWWADVEIVGQPGSLAARNYLRWQK